MAYNGYNKAKKEANERYLAKFVKFSLRVTEEEHQEITRRAQEAGKSMTRYIIDSALGK